MKRVFILVLDSFGVGYSNDANKFNDVGSDTFGHISEYCALGKANHNRYGKLKIPNLISLGLGKLYKKIYGNFPLGFSECCNVIGSYGYAHEISSAKDTSSGHWEIAGCPVLFKWDYFNNTINSFPDRVINDIVKKFKLPGILGNCHASGIDVLNCFGEQHILTNKPIFYTSTDSVFQVCCHEKIFGLNNLYKLCLGIREVLNNYNFNITRVIARPFLGNCKSNFFRTGNRKDFSKPPHSDTVIKKFVQEKDGNVIAIGKIADIFSNIGITKKVFSTGLKNLIIDTILEIQNSYQNTIVFVNFVDFDSVWGHRRDVSGYAKGLEDFDRKLPDILHSLCDEDLLIITSDHGCDPTWYGTNHTREYIPILLYNRFLQSKYLGYRKTFSDIAQTISNILHISPMKYGINML